MLVPIGPPPREPIVPEVLARYVRAEFGEADGAWLLARAPDGHAPRGSAPRRRLFQSIAAGARLFLHRSGNARRIGHPSRSFAVAVTGGTVLAQDCARRATDGPPGSR